MSVGHLKFDRKIDVPEGRKPYMVLFTYINSDFWIPELQSICLMEGFECLWDAVSLDASDRPYAIFFFPDDDSVRRVCKRSVSVRLVVEMWAVGTTYEMIHEQLNNLPADLIEPLKVPDYNLKFFVDGFGRKYSREMQSEIMRRFNYMDFLQKGRVQMKNPMYELWVFEDIGINKTHADPIRFVFFGRLIAHGSRHLIDLFEVIKRPYIGTTSMESSLCFLVANQAKANKDTLIIDPFCGTGSLLLTCAYFGSYVYGCDLDARVIRGMGKEKSVIDNFLHFNLRDKLVDLLISDHALLETWRHKLESFDAIVTDPPYGVRAGARKVGMKARFLKPGYVRKEPPEGCEILPHVPSCIPYSVPEVLDDLLLFSSFALRLGGRLIYWLPTTNEYEETDIPLHPCFKIISSSSQNLSRKMSRRLITLEKVVPFDPLVHLGVDLEEYNRVRRNGKEPAHHNFSAKVMHDPNRLDDRNAARIQRQLETASSSSSSSSSAPPAASD